MGMSKSQPSAAPIRKVLLVDDEPDLRAMGEMCLRAHGGWSVRTAASGHEALQMARAERPDIILLDVIMPDMDGQTTLARLRAQEAGQSVPVVFVTALAQEREIRSYLAAGAAGVINKPYDPMTFSTEVARILEGWIARDEHPAR